MLEYSTKANLQDLIDNNAVENLHLEFKKYSFMDGKISGSDKDTITKEIVAMANSEGGYIIIGIDEDGKRMASQLTHADCNFAQFDGVQLALQQYILAKVRPRLYGIKMQGIEIETGKIAIVISVPKSYSRPHAVNDGNKDIFFIRHSNGVTNMSVDDLRKQFLLSSSFKSNIRQFRQDRIGMILTNECIGNLADGAKFLLHIIPLWSLEEGNTVDIKQIRNSFISEAMPISGGGCNYIYNVDGLCATYTGYNSEKKIDSYAQYFRNGIIEAVEIRIMNFQPKTVYNWQETEVAIYKAIVRYTSILNNFNVPKPWYIYMTILSAKGYRSTGIYYDDGLIDRDIVQATECIWENDEDLINVLKPTFDSLANAFGYPQSVNYKKDGSYAGRE